MSALRESEIEIPSERAISDTTHNMEDLASGRDFTSGVMTQAEPATAGQSWLREQIQNFDLILSLVLIAGGVGLVLLALIIYFINRRVRRKKVQSSVLSLAKSAVSEKSTSNKSGKVTSKPRAGSKSSRMPAAIQPSEVAQVLCGETATQWACGDAVPQPVFQLAPLPPVARTNKTLTARPSATGTVVSARPSSLDAEREGEPLPSIPCGSRVRFS